MTVIIAVSIGTPLMDSFRKKNKTKPVDINSIRSDELDRSRSAVALICTGVLFRLTGQTCPEWKTESCLFIYS